MVKVKICGMTSATDARAAVDAGADALGFVFAPSPRTVAPAKALSIIRSLGPWVFKVGVFVNESPRTILEIAAQCGLNAIQLHGDEKPQAVRALKRLSGLPVIKVLRVGKDFNARILKDFTAADAFLFDTRSDASFGGTGKRFDWKLLARTGITKPFIISGGLDASNVAQAVRLFSPYGVDVSSGVEIRPGVKSAALVRKFIQNAKKI